MVRKREEDGEEKLGIREDGGDQMRYPYSPPLAANRRRCRILSFFDD